jgi:vacuolar-type H+-ATPase subunit C/Vma6
MKSRLLTRREMDGLADTGSIQGLISALVKTVYHKPVEMALARTSGLEAIVQALHTDLIDTLGKARTFYSEDTGELVSIVLRLYDIHNLKAILRGLARNNTPAEILGTLLPIGDLKYAVLTELARAPGMRAAIDMLVSMSEPIARPLLELRSQSPGAELPEMELALDRWHYQEAMKYLKSDSHMDEVLQAALKFDGDIQNLLTMLRFARDPDERRRLGDLAQLLVGAGDLPPALLVRVGSQESLEPAVELLKGTRFYPVLQDGLAEYKQTGRLSDLEKHLKRFRLKYLASLIYKDSLGIGVFLGYVALKINEINNLRWITHAINLGLNAGEIKGELEFVA